MSARKCSTSKKLKESLKNQCGKILRKDNNRKTRKMCLPKRSVHPGINQKSGLINRLITQKMG